MSNSYATRPIAWPAGVAKALTWDIEAMSFGFNPGTGEILCVSFKHRLWAQPRVVRYTDFPGATEGDILDRDRQLCQWMEREFADCEIFIGHYSTGFDLPFCQARMIKHGCQPFSWAQHIDTYKLAKKNFNPGRSFGGGPRGLSCSLGNLCKFFGLEHQKGNTSMDDWRRLMTHDYPKVLKDCGAYCGDDVLATENLFYDVIIRLPGVPVNMVLADGLTDGRCDGCGGIEFQYRGYRTTKTQQYRRRQCIGCGKWSRETTSVVPRGTSKITPS